jgi:hypothetical protein
LSFKEGPGRGKSGRARASRALPLGGRASPQPSWRVARGGPNRPVDSDKNNEQETLARAVPGRSGPGGHVALWLPDLDIGHDLAFAALSQPSTTVFPTLASLPTAA